MSDRYESEEERSADALWEISDTLKEILKELKENNKRYLE